MKDERRNDWKRHTGIDSILNGAILGVVVAGLLLAVIDGPPGPTPHDAKPAGHGPAAILGVRA